MQVLFCNLISSKCVHLNRQTNLSSLVTSVPWGGVRLSALVRRPLFGLLYQPRMIHDDECGAVGGMRISKGIRNTRRIPAPVPLCLSQIPHDLGSNPGRRGGKPAINLLSYGTALNLSTWWKWVISFTPQLLWPQYPVDRTSGVPPQSVCTLGRIQNFLAPTGNRTQIPLLSSQ
jgi:hypothetical protein